MLSGKTTGVFLGIAALAAGWLLVRWEAEPGPEDRPSTDQNSQHAGDNHFRALGVASCSAPACHGDTNSALPSQHRFQLDVVPPEVSWKSSYFHWANHDPHARAFRTLQNSRSDEIMHRLNRKHNATDDKDCLACHVNPTLAARTDDRSRVLHMQGVSCEACHGDAAPWRREHVAWSTSTLTSRHEKYRSTEMTQLFDVGIRARTCAGCHVGAPADSTKGIPLRDVNHDLIAAGHPRLNFEFTAYSRRLPPHWREKDREKNAPREPGFEAQFWLAGQLAIIESSIELLQARAELPRWPELAEFNCYACHHDLLPGGWRGPPDQEENRKLGSLKWNRVDLFGTPTNDPKITSAQSRLDAVDNCLRGSFGASSDHLKARLAEARSEWRAVRKELTQLPVDETLATTLNLLRQSDSFWKKLDWDQSARLYYSMIAIQNARRHRNAGPLMDETKLLELRGLLERSRATNDHSSQSTLAPQPVREKLRDALDVLANRKRSALPKRRYRVARFLNQAVWPR